MIRLIIVNETRMTSEILAVVLESETDMTVIKVVTSIDQALPYLDGCNVAMVSHDLPNNGAFQAIQEFRQRHAGIQVLITGVADDAEEVLRFVAAGAIGYTSNSDSVEKMLACIRAACRGESLLSPQIVATLMSQIAQLSSSSPGEGTNGDRLIDLTTREKTVLALLSRGLSNREIAGKLYIETGTVKNHIHRILKKLGMTSRRAAIRYFTKYAPRWE